MIFTPGTNICNKAPILWLESTIPSTLFEATRQVWYVFGPNLAASNFLVCQKRSSGGHILLSRKCLPLNEDLMFDFVNGVTHGNNIPGHWPYPQQLGHCGRHFVGGITQFGLRYFFRMFQNYYVYDMREIILWMSGFPLEMILSWNCRCSNRHENVTYIFWMNGISFFCGD